MGVSLNIGAEAEIDIASTQDIDGMLKKHHNKAYSLKLKTADRKIVGNSLVTATFGADTNVTILKPNHTGPNANLVWSLRSLAILDTASLTPITTISGVLCIGDPEFPTPSDATSFTFSGSPAASTFNNGSAIVKFGQLPYLAIHGTVPTTLQANFFVEEYDLECYYKGFA